MIPTEVILGVWRETKQERCAHPDPEMGHDLLPQIHLGLADGTMRLVMCEERELIPAIPALIELRQPIASAAFMADTYMREAPDTPEARDAERGSVARAFHELDPAVHEALVLHVIGGTEDGTIIQRYRYSDDGLPEWGEVVRVPLGDEHGAIPHLLRQMIEASEHPTQEGNP